MRMVSRRDLAVLVVGLALATWLLVRTVYGDLPPLRWWLPAPLAVLAVAEAAAARTLRTRLRDLRAARAVGRGHAAEGAPRPEHVRPVEPMLVARMAVLAQASAYVGAVFLGIWLGVLAHVAPAVGRLRAAGDDTLTAGLGVVVSAALVLAALWLESVCRVPPDDDGEGGPLAPHA
jgi:hypothetical protein